MRMCAIAAVLAAVLADARPDIAGRVAALTRESSWTRTAAVPVRFRTYHPQGLVKIGDTFVVSSVDREGQAGHLFKMDAAGTLLADLKLREGALYHPGGIDYDGTYVWVPVAEYRPD